MRARNLCLFISALFFVVCSLLAADKPSSSSGKQLYQAYCASCHGADAKGNGPVASSLKAVPTDLTMLSKQNSGKFPDMHVMHSIEGESMVGAHGTREMPVWGQKLRRTTGSSAEAQLEIKNLTEYLESIQAK